MLNHITIKKRGKGKRGKENLKLILVSPMIRSHSEPTIFNFTGRKNPLSRWSNLVYLQNLIEREVKAVQTWISDHRRALTKARSESTSRLSEGYFTGLDACFGKKIIVGKLPNRSSFCANCFWSPSARNFPTLTPEPESFSANSTNDVSIPWNMAGGLFTFMTKQD